MPTLPLGVAEVRVLGPQAPMDLGRCLVGGRLPASNPLPVVRLEDAKDPRPCYTLE